VKQFDKESNLQGGWPSANIMKILSSFVLAVAHDLCIIMGGDTRRSMYVVRKNSFKQDIECSAVYGSSLWRDSKENQHHVVVYVQSSSFGAFPLDECGVLFLLFGRHANHFDFRAGVITTKFSRR
jgi:hypothetical protein